MVRNLSQHIFLSTKNNLGAKKVCNKSIVNKPLHWRAENVDDRTEKSEFAIKIFTFLKRSHELSTLILIGGLPFWRIILRRCRCRVGRYSPIPITIRSILNYDVKLTRTVPNIHFSWLQVNKLLVARWLYPSGKLFFTWILWLLSKYLLSSGNYQQECIRKVVRHKICIKLFVKLITTVNTDYYAKIIYGFLRRRKWGILIRSCIR